jgi:hypothetical protein
MIKALAIKELREIAWIALLGLAAQLLVVAGATSVEPLTTFFAGQNPDLVPFSSGAIFSWICIACSLFAVALGLRQSAWENVRGTYLFLLYRPIQREAIFLVKLGVGLATLLAFIALPILLYAWWALLPRTHPSPAEWSMTTRWWQLCACAPLFYMCAFLTGLRPARWLGTRTLPLIATVVPAIALLESPWLWALVLPILLVVYVILIAIICRVACERDY